MKPDKVIPDKVRGFKAKDITMQYTEMQTILYALGVGVSRDPMNLNDLNFTYERADEFKILPTFGVVLQQADVAFEGLMSCPGLPNFNPMMLLHGEQKLEIFKPFPKKQNVEVKTEIVDVADKGKGALVVISSIVLDENKAPICRNISKLFIRGIGGLVIKVLVKKLYQVYQKMLLIKYLLIILYQIKLFFMDFQGIQMLYILHLKWLHLEDLIDLFYMDFAFMELLEELFLKNFVEMM